MNVRYDKSKRKTVPWFKQIHCLKKENKTHMFESENCLKFTSHAYVGKN